MSDAQIEQYIARQQAFQKSLLKLAFEIGEAMSPVLKDFDTTNIAITTDPTGLIAAIHLADEIPVGKERMLTVSASFTDNEGNSQSISGTVIRANRK